ncbi:glycosyltransferase family 4 protein [Akkermansia massiliensis]
MQRPRILHIFSRYGDVGEEVCFRAITEELRAVADVTPFVYSTAELFQSPHGALTKMRYMLRNRDVEEKLRECLRRDRYDAWIIHNTFPAMSPCVYGLALEQSVPVIHYLHNYRAGCLNGVFYRDGSPCFSCKNGNYLPGVLHACWRGSAAYSALAAATLYKTRRMGTWNRLSSYIAVSRRQRELLIQTGIPEDKIRVIPHFIRQKTSPAGPPPPDLPRRTSPAGPPPPDLPRRTSPAGPPPPDLPRRDVLYAGRLTQEKGVLPLVQAWERLAPPGRTLYLMGDGPLRGELERYVASRRLESIRLTGFIPHEEQGAVRAACGLAVAPSLWEETFGMVVLESWLHGTPVIVTPAAGCRSSSATVGTAGLPGNLPRTRWRKRCAPL